jgi:hypothetical protein
MDSLISKKISKQRGRPAGSGRSFMFSYRNFIFVQLLFHSRGQILQITFILSYFRISGCRLTSCFLPVLYSGFHVYSQNSSTVLYVIPLWQTWLQTHINWHLLSTDGDNSPLVARWVNTSNSFTRIPNPIQLSKRSVRSEMVQDCQNAVNK